MALVGHDELSAAPNLYIQPVRQYMYKTGYGMLQEN